MTDASLQLFWLSYNQIFNSTACSLTGNTHISHDVSDMILYTVVIIIIIITTTGQWVSPLITGDRPPPMARFTINVLSNNRMYAIIFGGVIVTESNKNHCSNDIYYMTLADNTVVSSDIIIID